MNRHRTIWRPTDVPHARISVCSFEDADRRELEAYAEYLSREVTHLRACLEGQGRRIGQLEKDDRSEDWRLP